MAGKTQATLNGPGAPSTVSPGGFAMGGIGAGQTGLGLSRGSFIDPQSFFTPPPHSVSIIPIAGFGGLQLMGFRGYWIPKSCMGSEFEGFGFPSTVVLAISAFDDDQSLITAQWALQSTGEDEAITFFTLEQYADIDEQIVMRLQQANQSTNEDEAITEDYVHEMVSVDFLPQVSNFWNVHTLDEDQFGFDSGLVSGGGTQQMGFRGFWSLKAGMGSEVDWGFNIPVVTAISAFDQDDLQPVQLLIVDDMEQFSYRPTWIADEDFIFNIPQLILQETDSDQLLTEGFSTDRVPEDYEQWIVGNQLYLYWSDEDTSNSTFFSSEQYGEGISQDIPQQLNYYIHALEADYDVAQSTFFSSEQYADADEQAALQGRSTFFVEDEFGFNIPELLGELLLDEEIPVPNVPRYLIQQVEDEQFGQNPPFITATSEVWELKGIPLIPPYPVTYQIENDQYGQNAPFITSIAFDDIDQLPSIRFITDDMEQSIIQPAISEDLAFADEDHYVPQLYIVQEEDVIGQNAPFLTSYPSDDSLDQLPLIAFIRDDVDYFGLQVTAISAFDQDELPIFNLPISDRDVDIFGFQAQQLLVQDIDEAPKQQPWLVAEDDIFGLQNQFVFQEDEAPRQQNYLIQEEDVFGLNAPFITSFPSDDSSDQLPKITFVWDDTEPFGQNGPFITSVSFDDSSDQLPLVPFIRDDVETFGFNVPEILGELLLEEEVQQLNKPYPIIQQVEDEQFGQNSPFITAIGFEDNTDQFATSWVMKDQIEDFGFNVPEILGELLLEEELQLGNVPYPVTYQLENDQVYPTGPFITAIGFDDIDQLPLITFIRDDVDQFSFQPEISEDLAFADEDHFVGMQYNVAEEDVFGLNAPFIASFPSDDSIDQLPKITFIWGDAEPFEFNVPEILGELLLEEELQINNLPYPLIQQVEDEQFGMNAPFITSFPADDFTDQLPNKPYPLVAEDDLVFPPSTILPNIFYDTDFNPTVQQSYYFSSEDLEKYNWGWLPPVTKVSEDDSPYDSRMMQSFIPEIEDEQFNWGFDRSRFYALGDESPYFTLQQTRYITDDDTNWGLNPEISVDIAFADEDHFTVQNYLIQEEDVFGLNPPFIASFPTDVSPEQLPKITFVWDDTEPIGQNPPFITAIGFDDIDQLPTVKVITDDVDPFGFQGQFVFQDVEDIVQQKAIVTAEDEPFGFRQVVAISTDDSPEQLPIVNAIRDDADQFGFQTPVVVAISAFDQDELPVTVRGSYADDEVFGFDTQFVVSQEEISNSEDRVKHYYDDWGISIRFSDSDIQGPNIVVVLRISQDEDQIDFVLNQDFNTVEENIITQARVTQSDVDPFGQQAPFIETIGISSEDEHLLNPPYPITYQLDSDQMGLNAPFITSVPFDFDIENQLTGFAYYIDFWEDDISNKNLFTPVPFIFRVGVTPTIILQTDVSPQYAIPVISASPLMNLKADVSPKDNIRNILVSAKISIKIVVKTGGI